MRAAKFGPVTSDNPVVTEGVDVLVIGGGQAGLAMGYYLAERGFSFVIADANPEVGQMWRSRWRSLKLFTAGQYNDLPGIRFSADPDAYPGKDDVADFLRSYAEKFELPVRLSTTVTRLSRSGARYFARDDDRADRGRPVVVATGPFQIPFTPNIAAQLDPKLTQLHSAEYQGPEDLPDGRVLVVGAANSGQQIALELSETREVGIAVGTKLPRLPQRWLGRDLWWWLETLRVSKGPGFVAGRAAALAARRRHRWRVARAASERRQCPAASRERRGAHGYLRRRRVSRLRRVRLGHWISDGPLVD